MENEKPTTEEYKRAMAAIGRLTSEEVTTFLSERGARPACPSCGSNQWTIFKPATEGVGKIDLQTPADILAEDFVLGGAMIPVIVMQCDNCVFLRTHAALSIARWKLEREAPQ